MKQRAPSGCCVVSPMLMPVIGSASMAMSGTTRIGVLLIVPSGSSPAGDVCVRDACEVGIAEAAVRSAGLAIGRPAAAIASFVFLGIGLASVIPAVFSAAGRIAGLHPGTAVATVSACGWTGFVCGPPLIGHLASLASLSLALGLLPFLLKRARLPLS